MENKIIKIVEGDLENKIYIVRGQKVMLDFDLAKIYGYTTKAFNQQVKNNIKKFDEDFRFQLTREEFEQILMRQSIKSDLGNLRSKILTSSWGGIRYLPYVFTEQGIYMLMTVLKGELAVQQSKTLIRLFKGMKDHLLDEKSLISKVIDNAKDIVEIKVEIEGINDRMTEMMKKSEISPIFLDFAKTMENKEFLLLEGEPIRAKEAYMEIYKCAREKIYIVDNYVNLKTLHLLQIARQNIEVTFFTDNVRNYLRQSDVEDFKKERPDLKINFVRTYGKIHDRFIILDEKKAYQAGGSSKDAGNKMTFIHEITESFLVDGLIFEIEKLKQNPKLKLN